MNRTKLGWGIVLGGLIAGAAAMAAGIGVVESVAVAAVMGAAGRIVRG